MDMAKANTRQSYRYSGPVTPLGIEGDCRMLFPGASYRDLPVDHPVINNLIERKLLVAETTQAEPAPTNSGSEGA